MNQELKSIIKELKKEIEHNCEDPYQAGLYFAIEVIEKYMVEVPSLHEVATRYRVSINLANGGKLITTLSGISDVHVIMKAREIYGSGTVINSVKKL